MYLPGTKQALSRRPRDGPVGKGEEHMIGSGTDDAGWRCALRVLCLAASLALGCSSGPNRPGPDAPKLPPPYARHSLREEPGQPYGTLGGQIVDSLSTLPVPGATIGLLHVGISDDTREDGRFHIPFVPPGAYSALISTRGYEPKQVDSILIIQNDTTMLLIELAPAQRQP